METKKQLEESLNKKTVPWEGKITNIQANILESLAKYKYLTIPHLLALDIGTNQYKYMWKQISSLRDRRKPLVVCNNYDVPEPRKGRVFSMYHLSKEGKKALVQELDYPIEDIRMPPNKRSVSYRLYPHRIQQLYYQIMLDMWAEKMEYDIPMFDTDFDYQGNNRTAKNLKAKTRIELSNDRYIIADGAYKIRNQEGSETFHLLEVEMGDKTAKAIKKIHRHAEALTFRCTHKKYGLDESKSYRVAFLFERESTKNLVIERAKKDETLSLVNKYFICKSIETIQQDDFFDTWQTLDGIDVKFLLILLLTTLP